MRPPSSATKSNELLGTRKVALDGKAVRPLARYLAGSTSWCSHHTKDSYSDLAQAFGGQVIDFAVMY
jgi:hypothetical protein